MGCGQKACADDEDEWDNFKTEADIRKTNWRVYSAESSLAKKAFTEHRVTGNFLIHYVNALMLAGEILSDFNAIKKKEKEISDLENKLKDKYN